MRSLTVVPDTGRRCSGDAGFGVPYGNHRSRVGAKDAADGQACASANGWSGCCERLLCSSGREIRVATETQRWPAPFAMPGAMRVRVEGSAGLNVGVFVLHHQNAEPVAQVMGEASRRNRRNAPCKGSEARRVRRQGDRQQCRSPECVWAGAPSLENGEFQGEQSAEPDVRARAVAINVRSPRDFG